MRLLALLIALLPAAANAARVPVSSTPQPNTKQLTLTNFGAFGGTRVGVSHFDQDLVESGGHVWQPITNGRFWLQYFGDSTFVAMEHTLPYRLDPFVLSLPFGLPSWDAMSSSPAITVNVDGYTIDDVRRRLTINISATDGTRSATGTYVIRTTPIPEPATMSLLGGVIAALAALPMFIRRVQS